jgi:hypothetical protein
MSKLYKWEINIWFQADEKGKSCGLEHMKLKTKPITEKRCKELSVMEAEKVWPHYELEITRKP